MVNDFYTAAQETVDDFLSEFGETVTYYSGGTGDGRAITAIVNRQPIAPLPGAPHGHSYDIMIDVKNDADDGITDAELDTGRDTINLPVRPSATATTRRITEIISQDPAWLRLGVR